MSQTENLEIFNLEDFYSDKMVELLYELNQDNTPEVGSIKSLEMFSKLLNISSLNLLLKYKDEVIGFIVCFRERSDYSSLNYKFFNNKEKRFLYIDRVVIKEGYRRKGYGTKIYKYLEDFFIKDLIPICCEVNSFPRNEVSINFHIKNGFEGVGEHDHEDHSVIYFRKIYIK